MLDDPHYKAREYWVEVEHPVTGRLRYSGQPFRMGENPWRLRRPAPLLGQHNEEVYAGLGYSKEDLVKLREIGVI
jgi:crotonobetainyl-CoA:carnitine CoA-transferase CaiB-like acyl-CoA transferase